MEELEIGDYINDINSYHLHMFDKHDVTTKKLDVIVEKVGKVDANYAAQIEGYCSLLGEYGKKFETVCAMLALDLIGVIPVIGALKYSDEIGTLFKNADKVSVVARSTDGTGVLAKHADEAGTWLHGVKVFRYSDETAEAVASGEKLLKESGTIYESFADMMSPEDAKRYLDFLENGKKTIRWYDSEGKAYRDVDMSDHGNSKEHPEVPHEHTWEYNNGKPKRN